MEIKSPEIKEPIVENTPVFFKFPENYENSSRYLALTTPASFKKNITGI